MAHILQYDLRPAKQVERRMMLDAFQVLLAAGFPIRDYMYLGMGSVFFWDYLLFHKLLGIKQLTSVEVDESITRRVNFNKPFNVVNVRMTTIGSALQSVGEERHLVWMDYDEKLSTNMLADITQAATKLGSESICVITVDVEPPNVEQQNGRPLNEEWKEYYRGIAGSLWDPSWDTEEFVQASLWKRVSHLIHNAIQSGLAGQAKLFLPMFHFLYRDGDHQMMTVGGMFGINRTRTRIQQSELRDAIYFRDNFRNPYEIRVPRFTRRERYLLDQAMPRRHGWTPTEFEAREEELQSYSQIYRFLPAYAELLL
jgi:hypothetical protein